MAAPDIFNADIVFNGTCSFSQDPSLPSGAVGNNEIEASANIDASKLVCHRAVTNVFAAPTVEPAASTYVIVHIAQAAGSLISFQGVNSGTLAGSTSTGFGLNLFKSTSGGAFATVLSSTLRFDSTNTVLVRTAGTIASATFSAGDIFAMTCTLSGSSTAARGAAACMTWSEKYA